jgi:hypothetical protein
MKRNSDYAAAIFELERFWEAPNGYFYRLRQGDYDPQGAAAVDKLLNSIEVSEDSELPRRLVSLAWYIPMFMEWQIERVEKAGVDTVALRRDIDRLLAAVEKLLGVP